MLLKKTQPSLAELTARFLARPVADEGTFDVEPHEVVAGFAIDTRTAWNESVAVAKFFGVKDLPVTLSPDWPAYVRQAAAVNFLPMTLGHFPQQVRDIGGLLEDSNQPRQTGVSQSWNSFSVKSNTATLLLQAASARVSGDFPEANRLITLAEKAAPDDDARAFVNNERAATLWQKGERAAAVAIWEQLPVTAVTAFNLGMSALATGRKTDAATFLKTAIEKLPETSGWHHLAQLYASLAS